MAGGGPLQPDGAQRTGEARAGQAAGGGTRPEFARVRDPASDFLLAWTDYPADEHELNEWYNRCHIPDRLPGVSGFRAAARYLSTGAGRKYLAVYETDPGALESRDYLELVRNRDSQTDRILKQFRNTVRTVGRVSCEIGSGFGSHLALLPIAPAPGRRDGLRAALIERLLPDLSASKGFVRALVGERQEAALQSSAELHARRSDQSLDWALIVHGASEDVGSILTPAYLELVRNAGGEPGELSTFRAILFVARRS
jgi:hypothetical protein